MVYKRLLVQLLLRVSAIVIAAVFLGWIIWKSSQPVWVVPVAIGIVFLVYNLVKYLNFTNRLLSQFFMSVKNNDSALRLPDLKRGKSLNELRVGMEAVNEIIKDLRLKYQQQEIISNTIIENATVGILVFTPKGMVEIINRKGRELLGVHHLVSIKALSKTIPAIVELLENIKAGENRVLKTTVNQKSMHLAVYCASIKIAERELKLISFTDIKNELDATELESWQKLINVLTHEIMNSVAPLISLSATLAESYNHIEAGSVISKKTLNKTRTSLHVIQEQSEGLLNFVENYRKLTRIPKPKIKPVLVKHLIDHVKILIVSDDDTEVICEFAIIGENFMMPIDENQVVQVLVNLMKNARQAITTSGTIKLTAYQNSEGISHIIIADNGEGIKETDMKNIFVPFFTTKENGSGIGLSITRQIMRLHNGTISVESVYGKGTKVELTFPV